MRRRIASVGEGSSCPYGATDGYVQPNGIRGFKGPAAGSLRAPTSWYVRLTGANTNGGSTASAAPTRSGTDGSATSGNTTFTSASAAFTPADVGQGICIQSTNFCYAKILQVVNATTVILSNPPNQTSSTLHWAIGGAWANPQPFFSLGSGANNASSTCGVQPGDFLYIGAGVYRQVYAMGSNYGSSFALTGGVIVDPLAYYNGILSIIADVTGQFTGDAGMVQLTAYLTNDKTAPSATTLLNFNNKGNLTFQNILFVGGTAALLNTGGTPQNVTFLDVGFMFGGVTTANLVSISPSLPVASGWLFNRCVFGPTAGALVSISSPALLGGLPDYNAYVTLINCLFLGTGPKVSTTGTASAVRGSNATLRNCIQVAASTLVTTGANGSTSTFPCLVYNCVVIGGSSTPLSAASLGQIVEDFNVIYATTPRTNVNIGAHSISDGSYAPLFHFGQERIWGALLRMFGEPMAGSPLLGFGGDGGQTVYDLANRPRPAGGGSPLPAVGALERGDTLLQAQSPAPPSGTNIWQTTGPGYQTLLLPVSAVADGFSIVVQRDSSYSPAPGLSNPALVMLPNPMIGVAGQTVVDSGGSGSWNTLSLAPFTPSGTGWVTLRLVSYDGTGGSVVSFANAAPS